MSNNNQLMDKFRSLFWNKKVAKQINFKKPYELHSWELHTTIEYQRTTDDACGLGNQTLKANVTLRTSQSFQKRPIENAGSETFH